MLLGAGVAEDFPPRSPVGRSRKWRSVTPFIPTRHFKRRGTRRDTGGEDGFLESTLREDLARRGLPEPVSVRRLPDCRLRGRSIRWIEFRRERLRGGGTKGGHPGAGFEVEFAEPLRGPLALGYGCHFGLGLFLPT
jgi:CRISPR-associated protein Csb2